jgi:hypothetical protein
MPKSQQSWIRSQHPPTQWNLRAADEAVLNTVHRFIDLNNTPVVTCYILISFNGFAIIKKILIILLQSQSSASTVLNLPKINTNNCLIFRESFKHEQIYRCGSLIMDVYIGEGWTPPSPPPPSRPGSIGQDRGAGGWGRVKYFNNIYKEHRVYKRKK